MQSTATPVTHGTTASRYAPCQILVFSSGVAYDG